MNKLMYAGIIGSVFMAFLASTVYCMEQRTSNIVQNRVLELVSRLKLEAHPEGGFFKRNYYSVEELHKDLPSRYEGIKHHIGSAIYFLLNGGDFSAFHRLKSDEVWHHYEGSSVRIVIINPNGKTEEKILGITEGEPQVVVPHGVIFAATPLQKDSFSLVGCTVSPAFEYTDFEMPSRSELMQQYPQHETLIKLFTRK